MFREIDFEVIKDRFPEGRRSRTLTKIKLPEEEAKSKETSKTSQFLKRLKQVKLDPGLVGYSDQVSGLFENSEWIFVCSEHKTLRFVNEEELKEHFKNKDHKQSKFGRSQSMYD